MNKRDLEGMGRLIVARRWHQRLRGWFALTAAPQPIALLIPKCRAIHTFGLREPLTIRFLDREGRCLRYIRRLPPWRCVWVPRAYAVLETPVGQSWPGGWPALSARVRVALTCHAGLRAR